MENFVLVYRMYKDGMNELLAYVQYSVHAETFCELLADADGFDSYILMVNTMDGKMRVYRSYATKPDASEDGA